MALASAIEYLPPLASVYSLMSAACLPAPAASSALVNSTASASALDLGAAGVPPIGVFGVPPAIGSVPDGLRSPRPPPLIMRVRSFTMLLRFKNIRPNDVSTAGVYRPSQKPSGLWDAI